MRWLQNLILEILKFFFKCVKDYNTGPIAQYIKVDNVSVHKKIASMWLQHYKNLLNKEKAEVLSYCRNLNLNEINVTTPEMHEAVAGLMCGHFQFTSPRLNVI